MRIENTAGDYKRFGCELKFTCLVGDYNFFKVVGSEGNWFLFIFKPCCWRLSYSVSSID